MSDKKRLTNNSSSDTSNVSHVIPDYLLAHEVGSLGIGDLVRYKITIDKDKLIEQGIFIDELFVKIKNRESPLLKPVYLTGPYAFYLDIRPHNYHENEVYDEKEDIQFCSDLKPDDSFIGYLVMNKNSKVDDTNCYSWTLDIISQVAVTAIPKLEFSMSLSTVRKFPMRDKRKLKHLDGLDIDKWNTNSLWNLPPKYPKKPVHLVIVTHGIFSNIGCDMLYIKDCIEQTTDGIPEEINPNVVVRGCMDNMGKSAYGVHYLGVNVAKYILKTVDELNQEYKVDKISFIGHSLGGPTQSMAIHYLSVMEPDFFGPNGIKPVNFITLASPYIGVTVDFPKYVTLALDLGALGITGRDLTLKHTPLTSKEGLAFNNHTTLAKNRSRLKLLLEVIPQEPAKPIFERFVHRTLYANVLHDGIVPLRTAALLYLDWHSLAKVRKLRRRLEKSSNPNINPSSQASTNSVTAAVGSLEISSDPSSEDSEEDLNALSRQTSVTGEIPVEKQDKKAALQWMMPQALIHNSRLKQYKRTQTIGDEAGGIEEKFSPPPEASTTLSALSVLTAPDPTQEYIKNPAVRTDAIVHDKIYHPKELPPPHYTDRPILKKVMYPNERINRVQERIARAWQESMSWRKVLVDIKPDSHNNIVVRRRFVNLFGAVAITHLVNEHFGEEACKKYAAMD
ncbi:hypothetical protein Kpol_1004p47 [Vanderwaltozyma polyspora DSM 70294]|uniref:DUF676 domain-containing protein n=1 Tax=Vanderwaltozyma polyspora (strain ATCC 22028 / DSM 70294 / BCRC 21397 / CBS 2163 / NBRC 10782 / NRRL Y-8283 / UCD 57-17) TaxID=436907 RepID=A7TJA3_VANPO|nr:uncharacterized protein Kpol_1004p47 [Vanderwaltozyma polyspora DSM 70294]EDO17672.1 hypothetical protein Kpol_1004p47 [Vanderwaltozyma polyspora DSM 70294]